MNAIQALSVNIPVKDQMLNHLMTATLDNETLQQWEQLTTARLDLPTTAELITFLEARCRTLKLIQNVQSIKVTTASPRAQQATGSKDSKSYCNMATPSQCTLCNESHKLLKCEKFHKLQPRQRFNHVRQKGLCFNCLQPFVKGHPCSQQHCRIRHKRHHSILHIAKQNQEASMNRSSSLEQGAMGTSVNTCHTFKGNVRNHVLLATAIVEIKDKNGRYIPCRALLDSGSQTHFITEKCVKCLRLSRTQTHTSIRGISNVNTATSQCFLTVAIQIHQLAC
jgi:hypothetical protein